MKEGYSMKKFWKNDLDDKENELVLGVPVYKNSELNDEFTRNDLIKVCCVIGLALLLWNGLSFSWDKVSCAYKGYTYEKNTKRPIFSECLIQMKDGSFVPLERYINRVLTFNDLGDNVQ